MLLNRTFVWEGEFGRYSESPAACAGDAFECFFEPHNACWPSRKIWNEVPLSESWTTLRDEPDTRVIRMRPEECRQYFVHTTRLQPEGFVPPAFREQGLHWYAGGSMSYLFRPNQRLRTYLDQVRAKMDYPRSDDAEHRVVSIHVRRGDKARETGIAPPVDRFFRQAVAFRELDPHVSHIYLATDDADVARESVELARLYGFTLLQQPINVAALGHQRQTTETQMAASLGIIADILLLGEGHYFIGTCTSGVSRSSSGLMVFARGTEGFMHLPVHLESNQQCALDRWNPVSKAGIWVAPTVRE